MYELKSIYKINELMEIFECIEMHLYAFKHNVFRLFKIYTNQVWEQLGWMESEEYISEGFTTFHNT